MTTSVVCILALSRSVPLEPASGDIFKQRAETLGPKVCICSNHSSVAALDTKAGCESNGKAGRKKNDAAKSVVLHVAPGTVQVLTKVSDPSNLFSKKRFKDSRGVSELFQDCRNLDTISPESLVATGRMDNSQRKSMNVEFEDLGTSSPWIQQTTDNSSQRQIEIKDSENLAKPSAWMLRVKNSSERSERNYPQDGFYNEDSDSMGTEPLWIEDEQNKFSFLSVDVENASVEEECVPGSWQSYDGLQGMNPSSDFTARDKFSEKGGASSGLSSGWGWHLSPGPYRVVRMGSLFNPALSQTIPASRRPKEGRRVRAASSASAETAQSAPERDTEPKEERGFTSISAGEPEEYSGRFSSSRKNPVARKGRRYQVSSPWFTGTQDASSGHSRDRASSQKPPDAEREKAEDKGNGFVMKDEVNGRYPRGQNQQDNLDHIADGDSKQSQALWIRKAQTVVPRKQPKTNTNFYSSKQNTTEIESVVQALDKTTTSKGVANVMNKIAGKLTIQDLKQLLTELATGPQRYWAKAVQVFNWMHDMAVYNIDAGMYHSMIVLLGKSKKMDVAEAMIKRMKIDGLEPDNYVYTALVGGYVRSGNIQKGIAVLEQMKADGLRPPVPAYNILIDGCVKLPRGLEVARSLMKQMKEDGITPDRVTYTTMIIVYSRKGYHGEAIRMFREMQKQDCYPDVLTYNAVLNAYSKLGDISGMLKVHQSMVEQRVDPDTVTFNIILNALGRASRTKDVSRFYRLMRKMGVAPDVTTCSILVNAYGKSRAWDELDDLIAEMESLGLQPDLTVYNSLISIYGKAGRFEQVELIVKSLQQSSGMMFDVITYNTLIDVYGKAGCLSDVIKWFSEMRRQEVKPDVRTFNALVHAYGRASQYEGVKEVLNLFRADGSKPDLVFYHTLLFMFAKGAKYDDAWGVIEDMEQEGYTLTLDIYNSLLLVFGRSDAHEAVKMYSHMISSKVQPNSITFKVLIEVHARKGMIDECLKIYRKSRKYQRHEFNESLLSSVLGACCNMRCIKDAEEILHELEPQTPSVACFNWLILGYGRQGHWQKAEEVLERMNAKGLLPNAQSYSFLLEVYSLCGQYDKTEDLRAKMEEHGLINSVSAYNALLRYHVRCGRVDIAIQLFEGMLRKGVKVNHNTYTALLLGYGASDSSLNSRILAHVRDSDKLQLDPKHGIYTALLAAVPRCKTPKEAYSFMGILERLDCPSEIISVLKEVVSDNVEGEFVWRNLAKKFYYIDMNGFNLETQRNLQNSVIDALWWLGWEIRALRVVKMGLDLGIFGQVFTWIDREWTLNISGGSVGAVQVLLLMWISSMRKLIAEGEEIPPQIRIILAEDWQLRLKDNQAAIKAVEAHLTDLGAVYFHMEDQRALELSRADLHSWLRRDQLDAKLVLVDSPIKS